MSRTTECGRCGSTIVESEHTARRPHEFTRDLGGGEYEAKDIHLCSMCQDDLWEFVFEEEIDRSDKADPIPIQRLSDNVERHIDDLEDVIDELPTEEMSR